MIDSYPDGTKTTVSLSQLLRQKKALVSDLASTRLVRLSTHLEADSFLGWQLDLPAVGLASMTVLGGPGTRSADLAWAFEKLALPADPSDPSLSPAEDASPETSDASVPLLYELMAGTAEARGRAFGFAAGPDPASENTSDILSDGLPQTFYLQFAGLAEALREEGGVFRFLAASPSEDEQTRCRKEILSHWTPGPAAPDSYIGTPVRAKALMLLPGPASLRLRTALGQAISGVSLRLIGPMDDLAASRCWDDPFCGLRTMAESTARMLVLDPFVQDETVMGIRCREPIVPLLPATHPVKEGGRRITIGQALDSSGLTRPITLGEEDLKRHWQIIGQTGCGKSTLLATSILSAIEQGYGLTFFDPHGSTIDLLLRSIPAEQAARVHVIRLGDEDHPVPLNVFRSDNPADEERTISDLNLLFTDMFDPKREGFVGPRWERWFSTFASVAIAIFGRRASFETITLLSQGRKNMRKAFERIEHDYPALAATLEEEFGKVSDSDFNNLIGWALCKMQRLTSVPQLRSTLGAGANALDFPSLLESDSVTLIDLASPVIGTLAARTIGTLLLMQLWNAVLTRRKRDRTHLVFLDEAHLFQTSPLPQMLAESRKFSLGIIMAHQHCGQLTQEVLDALEANSASFSAFRLSARDAYRAAERFGVAGMQHKLSAMNAFEAITTVSDGGLQTEPFTLQVFPVPEAEHAEETARLIEERSRRALVEPFRSCRPLTRDEMMDILDGRKLAELPDYSLALRPGSPDDMSSGPAWLVKWNGRNKPEPEDLAAHRRTRKRKAG